MAKCKAKSKISGKQCKSWAMRGKDVCRIHGGKTPIKHGLYSKYAKNEKGIISRMEELKEDKRIYDISYNIAQMHAMLEQVLVKANESESLSEKDLQGLSILNVEISKMIERKEKIENKYFDRDQVMELISRWQQKIILVINTVVTEDKVLNIINNGGDPQELKNEIGRKILELNV